MIEIVYPKGIREIFSGRSYFLNLLEKNLEKLKKGSGKNILLVGQKFIGKSSILKEFILRSKDVKNIYIDLGKTSMSPERFAIEFVGQICFWYLSKNYKDFSDFQDIEGLKKISSDLGSGASQIIKDIDNELGKIKPDQHMLVSKALSFPSVLSKESGHKIVVCVKEFQNIFSLENYEGIKDIVSIFKENNNGNYIATSSELNFSKEKLNGVFDIEEVNGLSKDELGLLLEKTNKKSNVDSIYKLTKGHPLFSLVIADKDVEKSFVRSALIKGEVIYDRCRDLFDYSLNRARGQTLLIIILKILSKENGLRLSEVSKKLYRASPVTKNLLSRLMMVDLVKVEDKKFVVNDSVLKYWIKNVFNGLEFENSIDEKILGELVKEL